MDGGMNMMHSKMKISKDYFGMYIQAIDFHFPKQYCRNLEGELLNNVRRQEWESLECFCESGNGHSIRWEHSKAVGEFRPGGGTRRKEKVDKKD